MNSYAEIRKWREQKITNVSTNHEALNTFHDELIKQSVKLAMKNVQSEWGDPPAPFAFFLMGSAGRFEQSVWSDQDHGIVFEGGDTLKPYFLKLGEEIVDGLVQVGYELCDGKVMSSYPLWCQSVTKWKEQITTWLHQDRWDSLRHFSTFFDSRVLIGESSLLKEMKQESFYVLEENPRLFTRLAENVGFIKKGIGFFGQLLPEQHGEYSGGIHLKQTVFFPYVNSLRLLALHERIYVPSTLSRFKGLPDKYQNIKSYEKNFIELLDFRLHLKKDAHNYQEVHHIAKKALSKEERQELKWMMKKGYKLFSETKKIIENECSTWS
ncbi:DUF294 nucleotidyltransferase-like domain-containing protein [Terrihalobacillus insolitus]|uniref:DUF294 nucleotidyltransferase-like domain-containing protein n=1 Tax=Terrihalobacillus insolitus TaxID=2950438 RepID=UPI002341B3FD|nr:DUF294 nucleotidyltransferase-like domain-containing protein [Terrihalobacillus insolitus]MDC3411948.1 DUF294 nucleotidyltransferase-like domain-containing protein [Terrihalobacillus insolitus]